MPEQYDREAIDSAHKEGLFDSEFDPMVLGLQDDEKERLSRELGAAGEQLKEKNKAQSRKRRKKRQNNDTDKEDSFFGKIIRWIVMLFTGVDRAEFEKRQQLRVIRKKLLHIKPLIFNFTHKTVLPSLGFQLYSLYSMISLYAPIFDRIFEITAGK